MPASPNNKINSQGQSEADPERAEAIDRSISQVSARIFGISSQHRQANARNASDKGVTQLASFSQFCFENFDTVELEAMLLKDPCTADLRRWDLDAKQWRQQIRYAISKISSD